MPRRKGAKKAAPAVESPIVDEIADAYAEEDADVEGFGSGDPNAVAEAAAAAAVAAEFNYFFPSQRVWGRRIGWTRKELAEGLPTIDRLCQLIAAGLFIPTDNEKDCGYCDYAAACGDTKALAAASKTKIDNESHVQLVPLRELRRSP